MNRNSANCICPRIYLCVDVKELPELERQAFTRVCHSGKIESFRIGIEIGSESTMNGLFCKWCRIDFDEVVGVTGFEPVTLRLSSACSNQLSYTPGKSGWPSRSPQPFTSVCAQPSSAAFAPV